MPTKYILLIAGLLVLSNCKDRKKLSSNSTYRLDILTVQGNLAEVIRFEKDVSPNFETLKMNVTLNEGMYPLLRSHKLAMPFISKREQTGFLPVYAEYFYSPGDSVLRFVSYNWERDRYGNFFSKPGIWKEESKKLSLYNAEYENIKKHAVLKFGTPLQQDTSLLQVASNEEQEAYYTRNATWDNDSIYANLGMVFASETYRIRLYYYWKK